MSALTLLVLTCVKRWITTTQAEREQLAAATRAADDERLRYMAALASVDLERQRVRRDAVAEREQNLVRLQAAQTAMRERFEQERAQLICDTFETAVQLVASGVLNDPEPGDHAKVIGLFPDQHPARHREQEPTRERGATHS